MQEPNGTDLPEMVTWLRAQLVEIKKAAERVQQPYRLYVSDEGRVSEPARIDDLHGPHDGEYATWADGSDRMPNDINNWDLIFDPRDVIADCDAKLEVVSDVSRTLDYLDDSETPEGAEHRHTCERMLRLLATAYRHRDGYKETWAA
jgi:hypothetical protein